jgi:hypothetical protein
MHVAYPSQPMHRQGLGRQKRPDIRDFILTDDHFRTLVRREALKIHKQPWHIEPNLDQGNTSECVIHCLMHSKQNAPFMCLLDWPRGERTALYHEAQARDGDPTPHDGTTFRAGAEIFVQHGLAKEYLFIDGEDMAQEYLKTRGGLCAGTNWLTKMLDDVDKHGYITVDGEFEGGHEYYVRWYYPPSHKIFPDTYECQQSWKNWGLKNGIFRMKGDDFRTLQWHQGGDLGLLVDNPLVRMAA